jgi:hypothetical protein
MLTGLTPDRSEHQANAGVQSGLRRHRREVNCLHHLSVRDCLLGDLQCLQAG